MWNDFFRLQDEARDRDHGLAMLSRLGWILVAAVGLIVGAGFALAWLQFCK